MDIAVRVMNLTKKYSLYKDPWGPLKEVVTRKKFHKDFYALQDVSLDFPKGESIGILGKNGSGKSTLLKVIAGITEPTKGTVDVHGSIVFLDVSSGIDSELSGYDNIFMKGTLMGYSKEEMLSKVENIIEFSELGEFIGQPVKNYSAGMKSKLGFAISVNVDPDILIIDEALAVGDSQFRRKCLNKMNEFKEKGKTIIFVSHDNNAIESFCSKAAWIHQGRLITYGDSKFVGSLYGEFMSGKKSIESIHAEIEYKHSLEQVIFGTGDEGFTMLLKGYLHNEHQQNMSEKFEIAVRDVRTGETIRKPLSEDDLSFSVQLSAQEFPMFFKPGSFIFCAHLKNDNGFPVEFPLWAGKAELVEQKSGKNRFLFKCNVEKNTLELVIENRDKLEQQVNRIWFDDQWAYIEGVAFVRGYETRTADALSMAFHLTNLKTFKRSEFPVTIHATEEITENPAYNPQGKIYKFSKFLVAINLAELPAGSYESHLTYRMNEEPKNELVNLVWATKQPAYPNELHFVEGKAIEIQTASKYLRLEKKNHQLQGAMH
ncbi:ABC transporter ATP-binding protein [Planococcus liqunii]|uniref:ABC transporter ATP-binding protein n=1 Tax=Planococcus liqunii TaxID=3058394 RepID=A0ABT8MN70_9BACL|nr:MULTISPECIES: ABC transporter ATP-binding protein [unclassified Planococcus (in: firmicutes)]MDN7226339.1 ABC transporter ATP-binding protein [Planococcus sp. N064]WKA50113.1 ABC transporter ATP-binding protein [Planococcus sp. N056]